MKYCDGCGEACYDDERYCVKCGFELPGVRCQYCGHDLCDGDIANGDYVCPKCDCITPHATILDQGHDSYVITACESCKKAMRKGDYCPHCGHDMRDYFAAADRNGKIALKILAAFVIVCFLSPVISGIGLYIWGRLAWRGGDNLDLTAEAKINTLLEQSSDGYYSASVDDMMAYPEIYRQMGMKLRLKGSVWNNYGELRALEPDNIDDTACVYLDYDLYPDMRSEISSRYSIGDVVFITCYIDGYSEDSVVFYAGVEGVK